MKTDPTILVIDDEPTNLSVLYNVLTQEGFSVLVSQEGEGVLELIESRKVDLVLLDIIMPDVDGYEICRRIKTDENTADVPVIFMSALSQTDNKVKGFEVGAVDFITKPFQKEEVLARIHTHLLMRQQQKMLEELNADKDKLFSILSHDLRSPFMSIIELAVLITELEDETEIQEVKTIAKKIVATSKNTYKLLENLLDWSRLQQGQLEVKFYNLNLNDQILENQLIFVEQIKKKKIQINNTVGKSLNVFADEYMFNTVIRNLLSNAIKFSKPYGQINISASEKNGETSLVVEDFGVGIQPAKLHKLFDIKEKVSSPGTAGEKGTGLGLILCKEFIEKNNGRIEISSQPDLGTVISISLPSRG